MCYLKNKRLKKTENRQHLVRIYVVRQPHPRRPHPSSTGLTPLYLELRFTGILVDADDFVGGGAHKGKGYSVFSHSSFIRTKEVGKKNEYMYVALLIM